MGRQDFLGLIRFLENVSPSIAPSSPFHSPAPPEPLPPALVSPKVWGYEGGGVNLGAGEAELGEKGDSADLVFEPQVRKL